MYVSRLAVWGVLGCVDTGDAERFDIGTIMGVSTVV